jgi:hypothetical protein
MICVEEAMVEVMMMTEMIMVVVVAVAILVMSTEVSVITRFWGWPDTMHVVELRFGRETLILVSSG